MNSDRIRKKVFLLGLCLPMLLIAVSRDPKFPLPRTIGEATMFPGEFKLYLATESKVRNALARWHSGLLLALNRRAELGRVVVGRHGWLFLRLGGPASPHSEPWRDLLEKKEVFASRARECRDLGVDYRVLVVPSKEMVYSEFMPERNLEFLQPPKAITPAGRFFLTKSTDIPTIELLARFRAEKANGRLWFKSDSHWNEFAGFIAAEEIRAHLLGDDIEPRKYSIEHRESIGGNEAQILGVQEQTIDDHPRVRVHDGLAATFEDGTPIDIPTINLQVFTKNYVRTKCPGAPLKRGIVFHNSYGVALVPFVSRLFEECTFMWKNYDSRPVKRDRPDVVIDLHKTY